MNIKIIIMDKVTEKFTKEAINEYSKRLTKYCKISFKECKSEMQLIKEISERTYLINVNSKGNVISSEDLAEKFSELALAGQSDVTFIIGENELSKEIIDKTSYCLAISKFDIAVSVLTVILFEQIYRAYRINKGEPYHK